MQGPRVPRCLPHQGQVQMSCGAANVTRCSASPLRTDAPPPCGVTAPDAISARVGQAGVQLLQGRAEREFPVEERLLRQVVTNPARSG